MFFLISVGLDDLDAMRKERLVAAQQFALTGCQETFSVPPNADLRPAAVNNVQPTHLPSLLIEILS